MNLTYDEYDKMEEACERIREKNENEYIGTPAYFPFHHYWPTLEQLEEMDIENHVEEYFPFLFFYYTQKIDAQTVGEDAYPEYVKAMKYIKTLIDNNIHFIEEEEEDAQIH